MYVIKNNLKKYHYRLLIMEEENLVKYLKCPLTKLFFSEPVLADDGHFYEFMAIKNHISKSNMSPVTNSKMGNMIVKAPILKKMLEEFLELHPEYRDSQFSFKKPFYLFRNEFFDIIKKKQFSKLKEFTSIVLNTETNDDDNTTVFEIICKDCDDIETINYIVDESIDFDVYDKRGMKPVHIMCRYSPIECLKHILDKDIDVNAVDNNNDNILSGLVRYRERDQYLPMVQMVIKNSVNVNSFNNCGYAPIHYIVEFGDIDGFILLKNNGLDLNCVNKETNLNIIQHTFKYSENFNMIKYLIELEIEFEENEGSTKTYEEYIYENQHLSKSDKQKLVLHYLTKLLNKAVVIDNFIENVGSPRMESS